MAKLILNPYNQVALMVCVCGFSLLSVSESALAQGSSDRMSRMFDYMDRNRDGRIDRDEAARMPGTMRDALQNSGLDLSRGISRDQLTREMPRIIESMRSRFSSSRGGFGGSSRGGIDRGGRGGFDRGRGDSRGRGSASGKKEKKPRPRVTVDLPEQYKEQDKNKDGQIALHEWQRSAFAQFMAFDINHDGFLTPRELVKAGKPTATGGSSSSTKVTTVSRTTSSSSKPTSAAPSSLSGSGSSGVDKNSREARYASFVFRSLDKNKDGSLTADEWERSRRTRQTFEKAGITLAVPVNSDQFLQSYVQVKKKK